MPKRNTAMPLYFLAFLTLCLPLSRAADETGLLVNGERTKEYVRVLASPEMEGRQSATAGYRRAADWAAAQLEEWGLEPAGENGTFFQDVVIRDFSENEGLPALSVNGRSFHLDDRDFSLHSLSTPGTRIEADVVFVGYGISAPDKGLDEYAGLDVAGRIVLVLTGSPTKAPQDRSWFTRGGAAEEENAETRDKWEAESNDQAKIKTAHDKGAAAVLLFDPDATEDDPSRRFRSFRRSRDQEFKPERDFLCFTIEERVFRAIVRSDSQETARGTTRRIDAIRRAIKDEKPGSHATGARASLKGYDAVIRHNEENGNNIARNVLAKISGTDPDLRSEFIVIGGHLDHMGMRDGYVYNGADDNASGSAVIMEVARTLVEGGFEPRRTIIFALWCGEEDGLIGSNHYTEKPCDGVTMEKVVANFTIDMVGKGETIGASGALNFPVIWDVIVRGQDPDVMKAIEPSTGGPGGSDHSGFIEKGIESMLLLSREGSGHPDYHQPEDDIEKIEPEILRKTGQFVLQGTMNLAMETDVDLLIEDRETIYLAQRMRIGNYNPALAESSWSLVSLDAEGRDALYDTILAEALKAAAEAQPQQGQFGFAMGGRGSAPSGQDQARPRPRQSIGNGIADLSVFEGDVRLLEIAADFFGIGRADIAEDDGIWIAGGRLTDAGREALAAMEAKNIAVHLASPGKDLISDFIAAAGKPFLITGDYALTGPQALLVAEKGVICGVDLDPRDVDGFVARVEAMSKLVGKKECLVAFLASTEGLDEAKMPLFNRLVEAGWTREEISGDRRRRGGLMGGNIRALGGRQGRSRRFGGERPSDG